MGIIPSLEDVSDLIDKETCIQICGRHFNEKLFHQLAVDGKVPKQALRSATSKFDIFITHDWGRGELVEGSDHRVEMINNCFKDRGLKTWFSTENISDDSSIQELYSAVGRSDCILVFLTTSYIEKVLGDAVNDRCCIEFGYISMQCTSMKVISVVLEESLRNVLDWPGVLGDILGKLPCIQITGDLSESAYLNSKVDELLAAITQVIGADAALIQSLKDHEHPQEQSLHPIVVEPFAELSPSSTKSLTELSLDEVSDLMRTLGLEPYVSAFSKKKIDGSKINRCNNMNLLMSLGIKDYSQAKSFHLKLEEFRNSGVPRELLREADVEVVMDRSARQGTVLEGNNSRASREEGNNEGNLSSLQSSTVVSDAIDEGDPADMSTEAIARHRYHVLSEDPVLQLAGMKSFRRLLSTIEKPPVQQVIDCGVIDTFVSFLRRDDYPTLQLQAAWALTNVACGDSDQTRVVVDAGVVPLFVTLLASPNDEICEQAAWALGNIAGDSVPFRDLVLSSGALPALLQVGRRCLDAPLGLQTLSPRIHQAINPSTPTTTTDTATATTTTSTSKTTTTTIVRNITWAMSNLFRGKPRPDIEAVKVALPLLARLLDCKDQETVKDACFGLSYLSDGPNERIQTVLDAGVAPRIVQLLSDNNSPDSVRKAALRAVGNIVSGDHSQTDVIVQLNALSALEKFLDNPDEKVRKEACWAISNIAAGSSAQIQAVIDAGVLVKLIGMLNDSQTAPKVRREAAWAVAQAASGGTAKQITKIVSLGAISALCKQLRVIDKEIIKVALDGLIDILKTRKSHDIDTDNSFAAEVTDCGGSVSVDELMSNKDYAAKCTKLKRLLR